MKMCGAAARDMAPCYYFSWVENGNEKTLPVPRRVIEYSSLLSDMILSEDTCLESEDESGVIPILCDGVLGSDILLIVNFLSSIDEGGNDEESEVGFKMYEKLNFVDSKRIYILSRYLGFMILVNGFVCLWLRILDEYGYEDLKEIFLINDDISDDEEGVVRARMRGLLEDFLD